MVIRRIVVHALLVAIAIAFLHRSAIADDPKGRPRITEHVVLLSIDGIRNEEGFRANVGDTAVHPYIPRIWSELKPEGTVYTKMMLLEKTSTTTGIVTLYSGYWNRGPNRFSVLCSCSGGFRDNRSHAPLLGEHMIKDLGVDAGEISYYNNKRNGLICDHSFHPDYGAAFAPGNIVFIDSKDPLHPFREDTNGDGILEFVDDVNADDAVMDRIEQDLAFEEGRISYPKLVMAHIGVVDLAGHVGQFSLYAEAIRNADERVADLWQFLQAHPIYAGKTTLIVTTDHGRHDDDHGGFTNHNGSCFGCRNLFFIAIGPDTPKNQVVERRAFMTDIAPTVGALLGFTLPHSHGRVLDEMIEVPHPASGRILDHEAISLGSEVLVAATTDSFYQPSRVEVFRGTPSGNGLVFGAGQTVSSPSSMLAMRPALAKRSGSLLVSWREIDRPRGYWRSMAAPSYDLGGSFSAPRTVIQGRREVESNFGFRMVEAPVIQPTPAGYDILFPMKSSVAPDHIVTTSSTNEFQSLTNASIAVRTGSGISFTSEFDMVRTAGFPDGTYGIAWVQLDRSFNDDPMEVFSYEVFYRRALTSGFGPRVRITNDNDPSFHPRMVHDPASDSLFMVYSNRLLGVWQVYLRQSNDRGDTFLPAVALTNSPGGAWKGAVVWDPTTSELLVAFEDHDSSIAQVSWVAYDPGTGNITSPQSLSDPSKLSRAPQITRLDDGSVFVTWEELDSTSDTFSLRGAKIR